MSSRFLVGVGLWVWGELRFVFRVKYVLWMSFVVRVKYEFVFNNMYLSMYFLCNYYSLSSKIVG